MLKEIKLKNFKLHRDTLLKFGKITLFIGPNNSGKSSAIHAMQVLKKEFVRHADKFIDVDLDHFDDLICHGENFFEIKISGKIPLKNFLSLSELEIAKKFIDGDEVEVFSTYIFRDGKFFPEHRIRFVTLGDQLKPGKFEIYTEDYAICWKRDSIGRSFKLLIEKNNSFEIFSKHGKINIGPVRMKLNRMHPSSLGYSDLPGGKKDDEILELIYKVIQNILSSPEHLIKSFHFVYPIRGLEWQGYDIEQNKESSNLNLDNISIEKRAKSVANAFSYNRNLEDEIYERIKDVVDVKFFAELSSFNKIRLVSRISKKVGIPFMFEGLGSHQMLFMFVPIALAKPNETIFIEEPENHLHPKAQYELSKKFTEIAEKQEKQLVMTTHSEHIVFGFLNMVAKKQLKKNDLKIYFFENKDGEAKVKELKVNEFGQVDGGLPGFFEAEVEGLLEFLGEPEEKGK